MPSVEAERILAELQAVKDKPGLPIAEARRERNERAEADDLPDGLQTEAVTAGGVLAEWVTHPECDSDDVFLLLHGGGFCSGGPVTHRKFAAFLSKSTNMKVLVPDYRLAPEHPFPAGVHDCLAVYGALLNDGVPARRIVVGGDSAGGGLAASMLLALREAGAPMPAALALQSPWLDLTNSGESYRANAERDPTISLEHQEEMARWYVDEADPRHPIVSPMFADLNDFPPTLVQVGELEAMLDDSKEFAAHAEAAGVEVSLDVWPGMWHVWHQRAPELPEAMQAFEKIGDFVREKLG